MMNAAEKTLISRLIVLPNGISGISKSEFVKLFPVNVEVDREYILRQLEEAYRLHDAEDLGYSLILGFVFGFPEKTADILSKLILQNWHYKHEDIASALQILRNPETVDCLYQTALKAFPYLDFDDNFALGVKCVWALYKIGTENAKEKLTLLADSSNEIIKENAIKLLNRMT